MADKIKLGAGKRRDTNWITGYLKVDDLKKWIVANKGEKYLNISISTYPDSQYDNDTAIFVNDYKPKTQSEPVQNSDEEIDVDEIPF